MSFQTTKTESGHGMENGTEIFWKNCLVGIGIAKNDSVVAAPSLRVCPLLSINQNELLSVLNQISSLPF